MMKYLVLLPLALAAACSHHDTTKPVAAADAKSAGTVHEHHAHGRFNVRHHEGAQNDPKDDVGIVSVDHHGVFTVESAEGPNAAKLREAVAKLNASDQIDDVARQSDSFFTAERAHLRKYYGFELTAL